MFYQSAKKEQKEMETAEVTILQKSKYSYKMHNLLDNSSLHKFASPLSLSVSVVCFLFLSHSVSLITKHFSLYIKNPQLTSKHIFVLFSQQINLYYLFDCKGKFIHIYVYEDK